MGKKINARRLRKRYAAFKKKKSKADKSRIRKFPDKRKKSNGRGKSRPHHHLRFLVAFVLYHSSNTVFYKRYGGASPTDFSPFYVSYLKDRIPLKNDILAYREIQEADNDYADKIDEKIMFVYATNIRQARRLSTLWENYKNVEEDDEEFYNDVETYRKLVHGRMYNKKVR